MDEQVFILTFNNTSTAVTLTHAPDNWDNSMLKWERDKKYYGVFRSVSFPLKFVKDGAVLLRTEFYTYGLNSNVSIQIKKLNKVTITYEIVFTGKVDFTTFKDADYYVECNFLDGGLTEILKANEGNEYTLKVNSYDDSMPVQAYVLTEPAEPDEKYVWVMQFYQLFAALVDEITDGGLTAGTYGIKSTLLDPTGDIYDRYFLAPESGIKYLDQSKSKFDVVTSFADFFKAVDSIWCCGMGIETIAGKETIVIEEREYFYKNTTGDIIVTVGDAKNISVQISPDHNFSKIKCGYPQRSYNDTANSGNGGYNIDEPNTETIYIIPNISTNKEYDILNKYGADWNFIENFDSGGVGIDNNWGSETSDTKDTGLFIMDLVYIQTTFPVGPEKWKINYGQLRKGSTGSVHAFLGNMSITPKRCLLNHKSFIDSCCYGLSGLDIDFLSGTNDQANNQTNLASEVGVWQVEYNGYEIGGGEYFKPVLISIEVPYPSNMATLMNANPTGVIQFDYEGETYKGYVQSMEVKLAGRGAVKYQLLSTFDNDLTKLIR